MRKNMKKIQTIFRAQMIYSLFDQPTINNGRQAVESEGKTIGG